MASEKSDAGIKELQGNLDKLSEELSSLREELKELTSVSDMNKKIDNLAKSLKGMDYTEKLDGIEGAVKEIRDSKESTVIIKKIDDILVSLADGEAVPKKLDDLQNYIAGLSGIEEKVQDLAGKFDETNEIVGIIVRQLDDIERKYNLAIDRVTEAVDTLSDFIKSGAAESLDSKKPVKKTPDETNDEEKPKVQTPNKSSLPSTIDAIMDNLMTLVIPQTEATEMAEALEEVRDKLTTMIKGHTPVLFQFGKRARELKSYPPTATLNENDIASLSREIKSWKSKLKEIATSN